VLDLTVAGDTILACTGGRTNIDPLITVIPGSKVRCPQGILWSGLIANGLYAGSDGAGILKSTDLFDHWTATNEGSGILPQLLA